MMQGHWFINGIVEVLLAQDDNADALSILRHTIPFDDAPPWHVHYEEDETFYVLKGQVRFKRADEIVECGPGDTITILRGVEHGFRVISTEGAQMLTFTRGGFEKMIRSVWRPATGPGLPSARPPTAEMQALLAKECLANRIELLGPPIP